jgi:hypothetical protein
MDATASRDLERLEAEYRRRVAEIRAAPGLSWEKRERTIRELGLRFDKKRKQLQEAA